MLIYVSCIVYYVNKTITGKVKKWKDTHKKKLDKLCSTKHKTYQKYNRPYETIIHNYSKYILSMEEKHALSYTLDTHIPTKIDDNQIKTEFENFYQNVLRQTNNLNQNQLDEVKSKLRRTCENYSKTNVPYRYKEVIDNLSRNKNITLLQQDKGRGVVILDRTTYVEKCLNILHTDQFRKLEKDPTKTLENKVQKALRTMKENLTDNEYKKLYPTGSRPGMFYGTAKIHKMSTNDKVEKLTLRPIISNIGTATYEIAKYLSKLLAPLGKSKYTIMNTKEFINRVKNEKIPNKYKMISFDVKSLFTNVPLQQTIEIILRKIYEENKVNIKIPKTTLKELLQLCTKHLHFSYNGEIYIQCDGVAMGSPLGPVLANIFMTELEETIIPYLQPYLIHWKRYVDDTHAYILTDKIELVISTLNSFHPNIQFTYELEENGKIPFLDVLTTRSNKNKNTIETTVYRKETNTDIYINWFAHAPIEWKKSTLNSVIKRAELICSTEEYLKLEIAHIKEIFCNLNNYPKKYVQRTIDNILHTKDQITGDTNTKNEETTYIQMNLPYTGKKGTNLISKMKKLLRNSLPENVQPRVVYNSTKLSSKFQLKDKIEFEHKNNVVYYCQCPNDNCNENYIGETSRRIIERIKDHNNRDKKSHILTHSIEKKHAHVWKDDFKIIGANYKNNTKRKISEALHIKQRKPSLNIQEKSFNLKLFN